MPVLKLLQQISLKGEISSCMRTAGNSRGKYRAGGTFKTETSQSISMENASCKEPYLCVKARGETNKRRPPVSLESVHKGLHRGEDRERVHIQE